MRPRKFRKAKAREAARRIGPYFRGSKSESLPPIAGRLYKKLSQIYGIPIEEMTPKILKIWDDGRAYLTRIHHVGIEPRSSSWWFFSGLLGTSFKKGLDEEFLHSLQLLLMPEGIYTSHSKMPELRWGFIEPTANVHIKGIADPIKHYIQARAETRSGRRTKPSQISKRFRLSRQYFERHGEEALLLLYADPPKDFDVLNLKDKEKEFVQKGLLREKGGLTQKGIRYLQQKVTRDQIIERLREAKKFRRKLLAQRLR